MMNSYDFTSKLAIDSKSIDELQLLSKKDSKKALQEAAKQFEALFLHMLVKSMRDATTKSGLIDSQQTQFYTEMYDQQLSQTLASKGIGLADMMVEQLTRTYGDLDQSTTTSEATESSPATTHSDYGSDNQSKMPTVNLSSQLWNANQTHAEVNEANNPNVAPVASNDMSYTLWADAHITQPSASNDKTVVTDNNTNSILSTQKTANKESYTVPSKTSDFINTLLPHANVASEATGIPAHFMLAQAALESGWGKYEIRHPDNSPSFNLFGIKAGSNWKGNTVETVTTEYINGIPQKMVEKFRAYSSYEEGFRDYANLLTNNPRYAKVVNAQNPTEFAFGLQKAGYATDPQYGNKLIRILNNPALYNQDVI